MDEVIDLERQIDLTPEPIRTNCWTCQHSNADATTCEHPEWQPFLSPMEAAIGDWIDRTHPPCPCPRTATGCPGWTKR
jgi:hypothetical protein